VGRIGVTGRFKTSHSWALFKTSHDVMDCCPEYDSTAVGRLVNGPAMSRPSFSLPNGETGRG
jgi:hypothetical protein